MSRKTAAIVGGLGVLVYDATQPKAKTPTKASHSAENTNTNTLHSHLLFIQYVFALCSLPSGNGCTPCPDCCSPGNRCSLLDHVSHCISLEWRFWCVTFRCVTIECFGRYYQRCYWWCIDGNLEFTWLLSDCAIHRFDLLNIDIIFDIIPKR